MIERQMPEFTWAGRLLGTPIQIFLFSVLPAMCSAGV